jgi:Zn-dependent protease with chaperone function/tellurite resistance protein
MSAPAPGGDGPDTPPAAADLAAQGDRDLGEDLLRDLTVREAIAWLERQGADGARRQLLGTAMRLTAAIAPDVNALVSYCAQRLGVHGEVETFVYPGPQFNAAAVRPGGSRLLLLVSSSLLESFDPPELAFVLGHELGHWLFRHHRIPVGALLGGEATIGAGLALRLFAWQRWAEISADRAGVWCAEGIEPAARALFKLASGLRGDRVRVRIDEFLAQHHDLQEESERASRGDEPVRADWFATHPFSPLRLRAADQFARSELMTRGGPSRADLEAQVQELMGLMEPGYLQERSSMAEAMRRLLFAGGVAIAAASGRLEEKAIRELERLLGPGSLPFELKPEAILRDLPSRLNDVKASVPPLRRAQVLRDLCVIARADGHVAEAEVEILRRIGSELDVDVSLVGSTMARQEMHLADESAPGVPDPPAPDGAPAKAPRREPSRRRGPSLRG